MIELIVAVALAAGLGAGLGCKVCSRRNRWDHEDLMELLADAVPIVIQAMMDCDGCRERLGGLLRKAVKEVLEIIEMEKEMEKNGGA